jgi:hypothetical protein
MQVNCRPKVEDIGALFAHHVLGGGHKAGLRILRAEGREPLCLRLDPVETGSSWSRPLL